jgi:hypothetical protein
MDDHEREPTQPTQPQGIDPKTGKPYQPAQIPVPKVSTFRAAIRKAAQPVKPKG